MNMAASEVVERSTFFDAMKSSSAMMAMGVIAILMVMIIPIPPIVLDVFLAFSITFSIIILLMSMHILKPSNFRSFHRFY